MITNPRQLLAQAQSRRFAVPAFNVDSLEMAQAVVRAAEKTSRPVIMQVTVETLDIWGWELFVPILLTLLQTTSAQVALLLDHAKNVQAIEQALAAGFTGVMYDGSALPLEENIIVTQKVVDFARRTGAFVEGEVGHVSRDGEPLEWEHLTTVEEAEVYWNSTKVDALAVAVGSKHGHYREAHHIRIDRLDEISTLLRVPLVLHGGSGMPESLFPHLIKSGIAKVNIGTELRRAWWFGLRNAGDVKPREALLAARDAVNRRAVEIAITVAKVC